MADVYREIRDLAAEKVFLGDMVGFEKELREEYVVVRRGEMNEMDEYIRRRVIEIFGPTHVNF